MTEAPQFPDADFYDCDKDTEEFYWASPVEAVEKWLAGCWSPPPDVLAFIRAQSPLTVYCWRRVTFGEADIVSFAIAAQERVADEWADGYSDPESFPRPETFAQPLPEFIAAVRAFTKDRKPWRCEVCAEVTLTAEQVEAMMRAKKPEWFDEVKP